MDDKYGRPEIVAREVMAELMSLDHKKLGRLFMSEFSTMLLDTHSLLVTLNEEDWLVTNRTVADMEDKLPREERFEWAKQLSSISGDTKFEKFKNFLQIRKSVSESIELMGNKSGGGDSGMCDYCSKFGHTEDKCYTKQRDLGRELSPDMRVKGFLREKEVVLFVTVMNTGRMNVLKEEQTEIKRQTGRE